MSDAWEDDFICALRNPPVMSMVGSRDAIYAIMAVRMWKAADELDRLEAEAKGAAAIIMTERSEVSRLRAENERLREALDMVMTGGNHIATHLPEGYPPFEADHLTALETLGAGVGYDIWCCWKAIMTARAALQTEGERNE